MTTVDEARRAAALAEEARRLGIEPWQLDMANAVPTDVLRDIVADSRAQRALAR